MSPSLQEMPPPDSGEPGWYPDPLGSASQRYWDGTRWLTKIQGGGGKSFVGRWQGLSTFGKVGVSVGAAFVLLIIISAAAGGGDSKDSAGASSANTTGAEGGDYSSPSASESASTGGDPSENASDDNTPSVGPRGSVEVDTLRWSLDNASTDKTIGSQQYGLGSKANGLYVVVDLSVKNNKNESVTLTSEVVSLVAGDDTYEPDTAAEVAVIGSGSETFFLEDVGPGVTATGTVAFDVAPPILKEHPQLRFNELGFGSTRGYIALPPLSG